MARNQSALVNWSQYLALRMGAMGLHMLPLRWVLGGARDVGSLIHRFDHKHRRRAIANITRSLPHLDAGRAERIAELSMQHFIQLGAEVMFTPRLIHLDTWAEHMRLNRLEETLDLVLSDRPVILLTGHFGNWELLGYALATLGIGVNAIARPIDNPLVNRWLLGVRERQGMRVITKWGATDEMQRILEVGGTLGFIGDQNAGDKGMFVPFFGRLASTYKSIGLLAMHYNAPVICGYALRTGEDFHYEIGVTDIIRPEHWDGQPDPLYYLTARYMRAVESMVRLEPGQYLWVHRRWKSRPRFERLGKPMPASLHRQLEQLPWMTDEMMASLQKPLCNSDPGRV